MRGTGYAFGPSVRTLQKTAYRDFLRANLLELAWSHVSVVVCSIVLTADATTLKGLISSTFPSLSKSAVYTLFGILSTAALGGGAYSGLQLGFTAFSLLILFLSKLASFLPFPVFFLPPFDPRQYHRFFNQPYRFESVAVAWGRWHNLFARSFKTLGMDPASFVVEGLGGPKQLARGVGVMGVFALSGWLHEQGTPQGCCSFRTETDTYPKR